MSDRPNTDPPTQADHAETAGDSDTVDGKHANEIGSHVEAVASSGGSATETVNWGTAFSTTPVVTCTFQENDTFEGKTAHVVTKSTTDAQGHTRDVSDNALPRIKNFMATEATN